MRILALSGSLRRGSHNRALLQAAALGSPLGVELEVWDGLADLPHYDEGIDTEPAHAAVADLRAAIAGADALLIATPEYNASIPGALKNALDWASRPYATNVLRGKPAAVVGAATGIFGAVWAQAETRKVLKTIGAEVLDDELPVGMADDAFAQDGRLADPEQQRAIEAIVERLADRAATAAQPAAQAA